jgi:pentatricopeptide repeat protein
MIIVSASGFVGCYLYAHRLDAAEMTLQEMLDEGSLDR